MSNHAIIKNWDQLATSPTRVQALDILEAGIERVLPSSIMHSAVSFEPATSTLRINEHGFKLSGRLFVIGAGKASGLMAETLERIIGAGRIEAGIVAEKASPEEFRTEKIRILQTGHPVPDVRGMVAAREILALKKQYSIRKNDLVLCLISGGGSALLPYPAEGISLEEKQEVTRLLLSSGASINEINAVRKHLSCLKGGQLAEYFAPARVISLILSDVVGNDLSVIASGMTYPDKSTFKEALEVLERHHLLDQVPSNVLARLQKGCRGEIKETPKTLENAQNYIIGDLNTALEAMAATARSLGLKPLIVTAEQTGDTSQAAFQRAEEILAGAYAGYNALLLGGETTPTLPSEHGRGGRNQHFALATLSYLQNYPGKWVLASIGTDGSDFLPDAAGAIIDNATLQAINCSNPVFQRCLECYDSNSLLKKAGNSLIVTGNTHTNVGDIIVYLLPAG